MKWTSVPTKTGYSTRIKEVKAKKVLLANMLKSRAPTQTQRRSRGRESGGERGGRVVGRRAGWGGKGRRVSGVKGRRGREDSEKRKKRKGSVKGERKMQAFQCQFSYFI